MIRGALRAFGLILAIVTGGLAQAADDGARIALVVGESAYDEPGWALSTAADDAALVAGALGAAGFEVELLQNADHEALTRAVRGFGQRLQDADSPAGFFYFSGRAVRSRGDLRLLPVDIAGDSDVAGQALDLGVVLARLRETADGRAFAVVDACHAPVDAERHPEEACGSLDRLNTQGALVAFAAGAGERAAEGLYARVLAEALASPALPADAAFALTGRKVAAESGDAQHPWMRAGERGEPFYFYPPSEADYESRVAEAIRWDFARRSDTADSYRGYVAAHPEGRFRDEADRRISSLNASVAADAADVATTVGAEPAASPSPAPPPADPKFRRLDPEDLLLVETTKGRLLIEMLPELAPGPVARIRELARERYFDDAPFERVIDGLFAEVGVRAPAESVDAQPPRALLEPANRVAAPVSIADRDRGRVGVYASGDVEFGLYKGVALAAREDAADAPWIALCPGVAAIGGGDGPDATRFYIMLGESPGMDAAAQPWGRVIEGLEILYDLAVGDVLSPGFEPDRMTRVRVAAELSPEELAEIYRRAGAVLDESGPGFAEFTASLTRSLGREPRVCEIRLPVTASSAPVSEP